jgi:tetratricopeptide (TPR) repeat protein
LVNIEHARSAMADKDWERAAQSWDAIIERNGARPAWLKARGFCNLRLNQHDKSYVDYRAAFEAAPNDLSSATGLAKAVAGEWRDRIQHEQKRGFAIAALSSPVFERNAASLVRKAGLLLSLNDFKASRDALSSALSRLDAIEDIASFLKLMPIVTPSIRKAETLDRLLSHIDAYPKRYSEEKFAEILEVKLSMLFSLRKSTDFITAYEENRGTIEKLALRDTYRRIHRRLTAAPADVYSERKIFGAGLSKTGTTSLSRALTRLDIDNIHWKDQVTQKIIDDYSTFCFGGGSDMPVAANFEVLSYIYPNSVFIYTQRPVESWVASMENHYHRNTGGFGIDEMRRVIMDVTNWRYGEESASIHWDMYLRHASLEEAYRVHDQRVLKHFKDQPERLLPFDMFAGDGWEKLCGFLGKEQPSTEFPRENVGRRSDSPPDWP